MIQSILDGTKKNLGIDADYTAFDHDILVAINSVFLDLAQIGIGPEAGFEIEDNTATWDTFLGDNPKLNAVRTYVYLRVRLIFDPPTTSFAIASFERQIEKLEWRLMVEVDPPLPVILPDDEDVFADSTLILDGGAP